MLVFDFVQKKNNTYEPSLLLIIDICQAAKITV